jgi:hypothetical protein
VTDELKRSGGITAAAVIALVGSVGALLFGSLTVFGGLLATQDPSLVAAPEDPAVPPLAMFVAIGGSQLALGVCGTVSAVGLLRLRNWARLSFVAFSALLGTFSSCGVLLSLIAIPALGLAPPQPEVPQGVLIVVMSLMVLTATTGLALGIWWLIYFNRASVRAQFTGGKPSVPDAVTRIPARIVVIAWLLIANGLMIPFQLVSDYPLVMFGFVIEGWTGRAIAVAMTVVASVAGVGLLRKRTGAHTFDGGSLRLRVVEPCRDVWRPRWPRPRA